MTDYTIPMIIGMTLAFTLGAGFGALWGLSRHEWPYSSVIRAVDYKIPTCVMIQYGETIKF